MTDEEFQRALTAADRYADFVYFHLMGEPLLHPRLAHFLTLASLYDTPVIITTNGTLLKKCEKVLLSARTLHKVSISLHAYEANEIGISLDKYLGIAFPFAKRRQSGGLSRCSACGTWEELTRETRRYSAAFAKASPENGRSGIPAI